MGEKCIAEIDPNIQKETFGLFNDILFSNIIIPFKQGLLK
jgi:hypothetical protein